MVFGVLPFFVDNWQKLLISMVLNPSKTGYSPLISLGLIPRSIASIFFTNKLVCRQAGYTDYTDFLFAKFG
jgi:hypothetical protein